MNNIDKFNNMISAFQCDFSLARDGYGKLSMLDKLIEENNPSLLHDIELLEELEIGLRYGILAIVETQKLPIKFNDLGYNECPICGFSVETDDRYCSNCGQAIKLEIEEE